MKKLFLFFGAALIGLMIGQFCEGVTNQSRTLGYSSLPSITKAAAITLSISTGTVVFCSDCLAAGAAGTICISTGAAVNSLVLSTGTHCQ